MSSCQKTSSEFWHVCLVSDLGVVICLLVSINRVYGSKVGFVEIIFTAMFCLIIRKPCVILLLYVIRWITGKEFPD